VLAQAGFPLRVASDAKTMDERLFHETPMGLQLQPRRRPR
jgi:acyl CoA:acetate/3-ketoacid CoA transferase